MFKLMKNAVTEARKLEPSDRIDLIELFDDALFAETPEELESCLKGIKETLD